MLYEEETHHLVREGHAREGDHAVGALIHAGRETVWSSDEHDEAAGGLLLASQPCAEGAAGVFLAAFVKEDEGVGGLQPCEELVSLLFFLLVGLEMRSAQVGHLLKDYGQVMAEALHVVGYQRGIVAPLGAPREEDEEFHAFSAAAATKRLKSSMASIEPLTTTLSLTSKRSVALGVLMGLS